MPFDNRPLLRQTVHGPALYLHDIYRNVYHQDLIEWRY